MRPIPKIASNWIMGPLKEAANRVGVPIWDLPLRAVALGELMALVRDGTISWRMGKTILRETLDTGRGPTEIVESEGLAEMRDRERIERWVDEVVARHPGEVRRYREGEERLLGFLVGRVMRRSEGGAEVRRVRVLLGRKLSP